MEGAGLGVSPLSLVGWPYSRRVMFTIRMPFLIYFLCCFSLPFSFWCHSVRVGFGLSRCSFLFLVLPRVFWFCFLLFFTESLSRDFSPSLFYNTDLIPVKE